MKNTTIKTATLLIMASLTLCGCNTGKDTVIGKCTEALNSGDYSTAVSLTNEVIGKSDDDKSLYRLRGIGELGESKFDEAINDFKASLMLSNGLVNAVDIDTSYYLAVAEYRSGNISDCLATLNAIISISPKQADAYFLRGKVKLSTEDTASAIEDFDKTLALAPANYDYYVEIYEELSGAGLSDEATGYLDRALSASGKISDSAKGIIEYYKGNYTDARNDLENAKKSTDDDNTVLYLARTYEALGDISYAQSLLESMCSSQNASGRLFNELAYIKMNQKDYTGALEVINAGLTANDGEGKKGLMFNHIVALENTGDFAAAKDAMAEYLELYPDDETALRENTFLESR